MMILALSDLFYGVVLMPVAWLAVCLTFFYRLILWSYGVYQAGDFVSSMIVAIAFYTFFWILWKITKGRGMAEGDMYIALYMGLLLGWPKGIVAMIGSFILGAVIGIILIVGKIRSRKDTVPFVPFMIVAMVIALLWGEQIIRFVG